MRERKPAGYVVYFVYHKDELVYIGEGTPTRPSHATSGVSQTYELNKLHFTDPDNVSVVVKHRFETKAEAAAKEKHLIKALTPKFNVAGTKTDMRIEKMAKKCHLVKCIDNYLLCSTNKLGTRTRYREGIHLICKNYTTDELFSGFLVNKDGAGNAYSPVTSDEDDRRIKKSVLRNLIRDFLDGKDSAANNAFEAFDTGGDVFARLKPQIKDAYTEKFPVKQIELLRNYRHCYPTNPKGATKDW